MKVTCPHCGGDFDAGGHHAAPAEAPAEAPAPVGDDEMRCPKCDDRQPRTEACRTCGLRAERMADYQSSDGGGDDRLEALWQAVEAEWDDDATHDRFVEAASVAGAYAFAARRYRAAAATRSGDPRARARIDRVTRMAEAALLAAAPRASRAGEGKDPYRGVVILLVSLLILAGVGGAILVLKGMSGDDRSRAAPPVPLDSRRLRAPPVGTPPARGVLEPKRERR